MLFKFHILCKQVASIVADIAINSNANYVKRKTLCLLIMRVVGLGAMKSGCRIELVLKVAT